MGWNGTGGFSRLYSWVQDAANGLAISSTRMDADTNDIVTAGLGNCITRDGQGAASARIPFSAGISLGDGLIGTPAVNFTGDSNTGIYRVGSDEFALVAGGAKVIDVSTAGAGLTGLLTTGTNGIVTLAGVTGSVAENTFTTLFDPGAVTGMWVVIAQQTEVGDHCSMAIYYALNSSGVGMTLGAQYNQTTDAANVTFQTSQTTAGVQAKRNTGAGTGTITWRATRLLGS